MNRIEIEPALNTVSVRLYKQIFDGDTPVGHPEPHRMRFAPDIDVPATLDLNDRHLEQMGFPKLSADDRKKITAYVKLARC